MSLFICVVKGLVDLGQRGFNLRKNGTGGTYRVGSCPDSRHTEFDVTSNSDDYGIRFGGSRELEYKGETIVRGERCGC